MFAVVKTGGKQYRVAENDVIKVERLPGEVGDTVTLDTVLMVGGDGTAEIGSPALAGKAVEAEILEQARGDKIVIFKRKRRKGYRRKNGHRQDLTVLRVKRIGDAAKKAAKPKSAESAKDEAKPAADTAKTEKAAKPAAPKKSGTATKAKAGAASRAKSGTSSSKTAGKTKSAAAKKASAKSASAAPKKTGTAASKGKSGAKASSKPSTSKE